MSLDHGALHVHHVQLGGILERQQVFVQHVLLDNIDKIIPTVLVNLVLLEHILLQQDQVFAHNAQVVLKVKYKIPSSVYHVFKENTKD